MLPLYAARIEALGQGVRCADLPCNSGNLACNEVSTGQACSLLIMPFVGGLDKTALPPGSAIYAQEPSK